MAEYPTQKERQFALDLIEMFEDFLESKGIVIENEEKEDNNNASNIYGGDYCCLEEGVYDLLEIYGISLK